MNRPEHYREAERLLAIAMASPALSAADPVNIAAAQVHATLALAAATVDAQRGGCAVWSQWPAATEADNPADPWSVQP